MPSVTDHDYDVEVTSIVAHAVSAAPEDQRLIDFWRSVPLSYNLLQTTHCLIPSTFHLLCRSIFLAACLEFGYSYCEAYLVILHHLLGKTGPIVT